MEADAARLAGPTDHAVRGDSPSGVRLAELVAAFSLAIDLGLGQPMEHMLRAWLIATRLGAHLGLDPEDRRRLFYVVTLAWVGCVADTPVVTALFGDDIAFRRDSYGVDHAGLPMLGLVLGHAGAGGTALHRLRLATSLALTGGAAVTRGLMSHCLTTARMAERLGLDPDVGDALQQVFARWDGKGVPSSIAGDQLSQPIRLYHLADSVEVVHRAGGVDAAVDLVRDRRGEQFDPAVVDTFCDVANEVLDGIDTVADWNALIDAEPELQQELSGAELDVALETIADFTDLRSPSRTGHSRAVASLCTGAAALSGMAEAESTTLRRAALVHDIGLHGVPGSILDKAGPLTNTEFERVRMGAYYTGRMLSRPPALARIGSLAGLVHERLDGSGYPHGLSGAAIPTAGRVLAAADVYQAMTEPRAHRPPLGPQVAATALQADVRAGRLDAEAVDAVLATAGQRRGKRRSGPAGLTGREIEVLVLIARGASNRQVAHTLGISPRTAGTHIERIYAKIGASTRSTATLFAMQHGLLDNLEPLDL